MERNDDAPLWDLLGHSRVAEASPFFARNCVRAVRDEPVATSSGFGSWFAPRRLIPSFAAVAAVVIAVFTLRGTHQQRSPEQSPPVTLASVNVPEAELVATDLDVLSGDDDSDDAPLL